MINSTLPGIESHVEDLVESPLSVACILVAAIVCPVAVLDFPQVRHFYMRSGIICANNAGGSQCTKEVIDRSHVDYLSNTNM